MFGNFAKLDSPRRLVQFWQNLKTSLVLLIPNCTRQRMITYTNYLLRLIIVATSEDEIANSVKHHVRASLYPRKFCIFPRTGHVLVKLLQCSSHFLVMFCLCSSHVPVTFLSCSCHVHIMFFFHFLVMFLSWCCHVVVMLSSCQDLFFLPCSRQDLAMARA